MKNDLMITIGQFSKWLVNLCLRICVCAATCRAIQRIKHISESCSKPGGQWFETFAYHPVKGAWEAMYTPRYLK
jgi:hypothetical protein